MQSVTPYKAHQIINALLVQDEVLNNDGSQKKITPQMLYSYCKKGYIDSYKDSEDNNKVKINMQVLADFYKNYVSKNNKVSIQTSEAVDIVRSLLK